MKAKIVSSFIITAFLLTLAYIFLISTYTPQNTAPADISENSKTGTITEEAAEHKEEPEKYFEYTGFDFYRAADNIYVDGQKIELLSAVNELGPDFYLEGSKFDDSDKSHLFYKSTHIADVTLLESGNVDKEHMPIISITFYGYPNPPAKVSVDGIELYDKFKVMEEKYGEDNLIVSSFQSMHGSIFNYTYYDDPKNKEHSNYIYAQVPMDYREDHGRICFLEISMENSIPKE